MDYVIMAENHDADWRDKLEATIKVKDAQIVALVTALEEFLYELPNLWGDLVVDGRLTFTVAVAKVDRAEAAIKEATT